MKYILPVLLTAALLSGCEQKQESQSEHDAKVAKQAREALLKELKEKEKPTNKTVAHTASQDKLSHLGVTATPDGKIIIDTNKTKSYLEQLARQMKTKADELAKEMQEGVIDEKEVGIEANETKIVIDLNKTQSFMEKWAKKMQGFVKDMEKLSKTIDGDINSSAPGQ